MQKSVHENATECVEIKRGKTYFSYTFHAETDSLSSCSLALSTFPSPLSMT
jgi:hypothetical protein